MAECCIQKETGQAKTSLADKENIDPYLGQHTQGLPGSSMCGIPAGKQSARQPKCAGKGRTPLADITALCMLQASQSAHQQAQAGNAAAMQKGMWAPTHQVDKLGNSAVSSGGVTSGHRLAAMR